MNYYPHHIGDFNNATRNLSWTQKMAYRELIEFYYDQESPITANLADIEFRLGAHTQEQKDAIKTVLEHYFTFDNDCWRHERCDAEIAHYQDKKASRSKAGKASAAKRARTQQVLNKTQLTSNQEPKTKNQTFNKPSLQDCIDHIAGKVKDPRHTAEEFYNHYEACNWMIKGGVKMNKWRSALTGWVNRGKKYEASRRDNTANRSDKNDQALRELYS
tara:strand:- start:5304 stop:5954 length:651 start_codon:yes stop_codon:yes gene_type:complete